MLAIMAGTLDPAAGTASDRSEDALTDAVFGAIRHLPYRRVLGAVLAAADVPVDPETLDRARVELWPSYQVPHLPGMRVEPDVVVTAGTTVVVAVIVGAIRPRADLELAERSVRKLVPEAGERRFRWLPSHQIATCLDTADGLAPHERRLADDTLRFMQSREVREVFHRPDLAAFEQVAVAQRTAIGQLYPQLRLFFDSFTAALQAERVDYSTPAWKGMQFAGVSTSVSRPTEWARAAVGVAYWPGYWPKRLGTSSKTPSILAFFDFYDPGFEVSLTVPSPNAAVAIGDGALAAARRRTRPRAGDAPRLRRHRRQPRPHQPPRPGRGWQGPPCLAHRRLRPARRQQPPTPPAQDGPGRPHRADSPRPFPRPVRAGAECLPVWCRSTDSTSLFRSLMGSSRGRRGRWSRRGGPVEAARPRKIAQSSLPIRHALERLAQGPCRRLKAALNRMDALFGTCSVALKDGQLPCPPAAGRSELARRTHDPVPQTTRELGHEPWSE